MLVMDAQYTPDEVARYKGWGHSTWQEAVAVAEQAGISRLMLTHHDPRRNDVALDALRDAVRAAMPTADLARERLVVEL
jgi:ribonuclease BN (tRNA processing enzyme)